MLFFIPAWYQQNNWCENEQNWHVRRMRTEFDDTVKQIQLFHRNKAYPYKIMLLSYTPNFRHFLHRQGVYHAPYWSCFDAIQEIKRKKAYLLSFHNLSWPQNIEFIYTPFVVVAMLNGKKYAQVEFGEDGNPIEINMFENDSLKRKNIYDDRGFLSKTILFSEGKMIYEDYLTEKGVRKLRCYADGHVEINPASNTYLITYGDTSEQLEFNNLRYDSMDQIIDEVLSEYISHTDDEDIFCIAMHDRHTTVLNHVLNNKKKILSFFESRCLTEEKLKNNELISNSDYIITDSMENTQKVKEYYGKEIKNIRDITPYDTRVDFGISSQLTVQKILLPVDDISDENYRKIIRYVGQFLYTNKYAEVHLFTRRADYDIEWKLLSKTEQILADENMERRWAVKIDNRLFSENGLDNEGEIPQRIFVEQCVDELSVSKTMKEQRVVLDLREIPDLYLQISAISMGIPQIVRKETQYVENKKNGLVIDKIEEVEESLAYYLTGLANWNEAMINAYEIGKKYTTKVLVDEWKEVIDFVG